MLIKLQIGEIPDVRHAQQIYDGIYSFELLGSELARFLVTSTVRQQHDGEQPNSMNKYGTVLGGVLKPFLRSTLSAYVQPISNIAYPDIRRLKLDPYAFTIDYEVGKQRSLARHYDSSDVTLNVCLSEAKDFKGGDLIFYKGRKAVFTYKHKPGVAIVHRGSLEHRATPLTHGKRTNLVLWCAERGGKHGN